MKVVVAGASGLIGKALVAALPADGHQAVGLVPPEPRGSDEITRGPARALDPAQPAGAAAALKPARAARCDGEGAGAIPRGRPPPRGGSQARPSPRGEAARAPAGAAGIRVVHARTGLVVDRSGGAWGRMFPLFRLGLGGKLGSGWQWWSPISLTDEVLALQFLLGADTITGPVNLTGPEQLTNADVTAAM